MKYRYSSESGTKCSITLPSMWAICCLGSSLIYTVSCCYIAFVILVTLGIVLFLIKMLGY